jgi:hypothetical protein
MQAEDMFDQEVGGKFWKSNEVGGLRKTVNHRKDGGIAFRRGKTGDEVESNV